MKLPLVFTGSRVPAANRHNSWGALLWLKQQQGSPAVVEVCASDAQPAPCPSPDRVSISRANGLGGTILRPDATSMIPRVVFGGEEVVMDHGADDFAEYMVARWPSLVRFGYGLTGDLGLAEDLAQDALTRACASWSRVKRADNVDAYVRKIMINSNRTRVRRLRVPEHLTWSPPEAQVVDSRGGADDRTELMAALMKLPIGQRTVVVLRYWLDLSEAEIAQTLGCSPGNVKSQAARALAKLRLSEELVKGACHAD
jgi:RNA polymerase sigma-70 factor (sigma-E family)